MLRVTEACKAFDLPVYAAHVKFDETTPLIPLESIHILLASQIALMPHIVILALFPSLAGVYMKARVPEILALGMPSSNATIVSLDLAKIVSFQICRTSKNPEGGTAPSDARRVPKLVANAVKLRS